MTGPATNPLDRPAVDDTGVIALTWDRLLDIYLAAFKSGASTFAASIAINSGNVTPEEVEFADEFANDMTCSIANDPAVMEAIRQTIRANISGCTDKDRVILRSTMWLPGRGDDA